MGEALGGGDSCRWVGLRQEEVGRLGLARSAAGFSGDSLRVLRGPEGASYKDEKDRRRSGVGRTREGNWSGLNRELT